MSASPLAAAWTAWASSAGPASLSRKPAGAGPQRGVDVLVEVEGGDDDDGERVGDARPGEEAGGLDAVEHRHADVEQAHVGAQRAGRARPPRRPSAASPTTSMSGWALRIIVSPVRTISWSSATSTRMLMPARPFGGRTAVTVQPRSGFGPASQVPPSRSARSIMPTSP